MRSTPILILANLLVPLALASDLEVVEVVLLEAICTVDGRGFSEGEVFLNNPANLPVDGQTCNASGAASETDTYNSSWAAAAGATTQTRYGPVYGTRSWEISGVGRGTAAATAHAEWGCSTGGCMYGGVTSNALSWTRHNLIFSTPEPVAFEVSLSMGPAIGSCQFTDGGVEFDVVAYGDETVRVSGILQSQSGFLSCSLRTAVDARTGGQVSDAAETGNHQYAFNITLTPLDTTGVVFDDVDTISWGAHPDWSSWNLYHGDLDVLRAGGSYTQFAECGLTSPSYTNTLVPSPGNVEFFLITGADGSGEEPLGEGRGSGSCS